MPERSGHPAASRSPAGASRCHAVASKWPATADDSGDSLEAAIEDDPDDKVAYSVYGDWLQRQGELRGEEVIALALAAEGPARGQPEEEAPAQTALSKLLTKHAAALLGPLARLVRDPAADSTAPPFIWRHGFIARAELTAAPERPAAPHPRRACSGTCPAASSAS